MTVWPAVILSTAVVVLAAGPATKKKAPPPATPKPAATAATTPVPAASGAAPAASVAPTPEPTPTPVPTPSINQSIDFVKDKLATYGAYTFEISAVDNPAETGKVNGTLVVSRFDDGDCVLTLSKKVEVRTDDEGEPYADIADIELRIPLKEVNTTVGKKPMPKKMGDAFNVKDVGQLTQLEITGKGDRKPIAVTDSRTVTQDGETNSKNSKVSVASATILFADDDIAVRSKKALENAISLCQRRKEVF